ncbi:hypothetical protein [Caulobacter vibrioides]|jgi:hypothetical protein|uniref:Uncharacterized protein n=1 Tax=Caulobacter vibrioides OR37 TaxID=1292034 RepID=R0EQH0_CAUVI|nr:hypothetical protein [Caulobacter vibrioides]ENZ83252.1 hypothetical protein OR37_01028 [Caulobacter vibrioides OR37]
MHVLRGYALESVARDETPLPTGARYDVGLGAWRGEKGLLAYDAMTDRLTKKHDIETGEDQKGQ